MQTNLNKLLADINGLSDNTLESSLLILGYFYEDKKNLMQVRQDFFYWVKFCYRLSDRWEDAWEAYRKECEFPDEKAKESDRTFFQIKHIPAIKKDVALISPIYFNGAGHTYYVDEFFVNGRFRRSVMPPTQEEQDVKRDRSTTIKEQKREGFRTLTERNWGSWMNLVDVIWELLNFDLPSVRLSKYSDNKPGSIKGYWKNQYSNDRLDW